ncbi:DUF4917 family protein [Caenispirillum salinarum]|uniref:DUF4917 family protein n=1 Tax=Caenispirillum salinarum TaxID=859058 RepID=UPI000A06564C|nr:DUF4917 family protein [Caenispirillum salinarum]
MAKAEIFSFDDAMNEARHCKKKHILLGNGFSVAIRPNIFSYTSLYENADFSAHNNVKKIFESLGTMDFEIVIRHLQDSAKTISIYDPSNTELFNELRNDAEFVKDALVSAVAKRHPNRPFDIKPHNYTRCRNFLSQFDHIFTLNYDVILYWALMQEEFDDLDLKPDDGFRHPHDDTDAPYVSWQQGNKSTVNYLHGALHLYDNGSEITKYTWSKTDRPIVEQIRAALDEDRFPVFVSEGTSDSKLRKIMHNAYLHKAYRSFEGCCGSKNNAIVVYGHSLAENDWHILKCIARGQVAQLLVGIYGDPNTPANREAIANANKIAELRETYSRGKAPLNLVLFDAASANVWG